MNSNQRLKIKSQKAKTSGLKFDGSSSFVFNSKHMRLQLIVRTNQG